jgi:hypothetical protein
MEKSKGGRPSKTLNREETVSAPSKKEQLAAEGISPQQAHQWEQLADIPQEQFEAALAEAEVPTTGGIIRNGHGRATAQWGRAMTDDAQQMTGLVRYDAMIRAIDVCHRIDEAREIRSEAAAEFRLRGRRWGVLRSRPLCRIPPNRLARWAGLSRTSAPVSNRTRRLCL